MILAVDPGLATLGWALVEPGTGKLADLGVVIAKAAVAAHGGVQRDRIARLIAQSGILGELVKRHDCSVIAIEAMSFPPRAQVAAIASICLSWGALVGIAAVWGCSVVDVAPKTWQHAVLNLKGKVDYDAVFAALSSYVLTTSPTCHAKLEAIPKGHRNHALDAIGVGVYAAMQSEIEET